MAGITYCCFYCGNNSVTVHLDLCTCRLPNRCSKEEVTWYCVGFTTGKGGKTICPTCIDDPEMLWKGRVKAKQRESAMLKYESDICNFWAQRDATPNTKRYIGNCCSTACFCCCCGWCSAGSSDVHDAAGRFRLTGSGTASTSTATASIGQSIRDSCCEGGTFGEFFSSQQACH